MSIKSLPDFFSLDKTLGSQVSKQQVAIVTIVLSILGACVFFMACRISKLIQENRTLKDLQEAQAQQNAKLSTKLDQLLEETESQQKVLEEQIYVLVTKQIALEQEVKKSQAVAKENEILKPDLMCKQCRISTLEKRVKGMSRPRGDEGRASFMVQPKSRKTIEETEAKELGNKMENLRIKEEELKQQINSSCAKKSGLETRLNEVRKTMFVDKWRLRGWESRSRQLPQNL